MLTIIYFSIRSQLFIESCFKYNSIHIMISPVKNNKAEKDFDKKQKTIMSLKSLHIRQSLFYSLWEKDRIMKVSFEHFFMITL